MSIPTEIIPNWYPIDKTKIPYPKPRPEDGTAIWHCAWHGQNDTHGTRGCRQYCKTVGLLPNPWWHGSSDKPEPDDQPQPQPTKAEPESPRFVPKSPPQRPSMMESLKYANKRSSETLGKMHQAARREKKVKDQDKIEKLQAEIDKIRGGRVEKTKKK